MDKTFELCPFCESEVELLNELKPQKCPECGEMIMPCAYCNDLKLPCDFQWHNVEKTIGGCRYRK